MKKIAVVLLPCFFFICVICTLFNFFSKTDSFNKEANMLNERQKEILREEGLPTDYDELSLSKRISIEAIEDIFQYLDKTYPEEKFKYAGYVPQSAVDNECLIVTSQFGTVTVWRDLSGDNPVFKDDFIEVKKADEYASTINEALSKEFNENDYIVSVKVSQINNNDTVSDGTSTVIKYCNANITVFVNEKVGENEFDSIVSFASKFLSENVGNNSVDAEFFYVQESEFIMSLPDDYYNSINMDIFIKQMNYYHRKNGDESLYEVER